MSGTKRTLLITALMLVGVAGLTGCRDWSHQPGYAAPGDIIPQHGEPAEGGYYKNWDPYAVKIEVMPETDVNPVKTQHVLIATVLDENGNPLPNRRVEWFIAPESVGHFVEVDESGWRASRGHKVTQAHAVTHTNNFDHVLTRGNDDPADDVHLKKGQTWAVITSPIEGTTYVTAYAPAIYNWDEHKAFVVKHWWDVTAKFPPDAVNRVGEDHTMTTHVMQNSDGAPLQGYPVKYRIVSGPPATLDGQGQEVTKESDGNGRATVTLRQQQPTTGANEVEISVYRTVEGENMLVKKHTMTKRWIAPQIDITKSAPAKATVGEQFQYTMTVTNPGQADARNVVVTDTLPNGIEYVSSTPRGGVSGQTVQWKMASLASGASQTVNITVRGTRTGSFTNVARVTADDGLSDQAQAVTVISKADISLTKEGPAESILCDPFDFTMVIRNTGDAPATNVRIVDELPNGLVRADNSETQAVYNVGTLQPGQARRATLRVKAQRTGSFTNTANATADGNLSDDASATTVVKAPKLEITKTGPAERFLGTKAQYTITVKNVGDFEARNTTLTDQLPSGMSFDSASDGGSASGGTVTWDLGTIQPNGSKKVTLTLNADNIGTHVDRATAKAYCADAVTAQATTEVKGRAAVLLEVVDTQDPIEVGKNETYVITVTNQGTAPDTNIQVVVTLCDKQQHVSQDGPTKANIQGQKATFAKLAKLEPGQKATWKLVAKGVGTGDCRLDVKLTSDVLGTTPVTETESTHIYDNNE